MVTSAQDQNWHDKWEHTRKWVILIKNALSLLFNFYLKYHTEKSIAQNLPWNFQLNYGQFLAATLTYLQRKEGYMSFSSNFPFHKQSIWKE